MDGVYILSDFCCFLGGAGTSQEGEANESGQRQDKGKNKLNY